MRTFRRFTVLVLSALLAGCPGPASEGEPDTAATPDATADEGGDGSSDVESADAGCSPESCAALNVAGSCTLWACNPVLGQCEERTTKDYVPCTVTDACFDVGFCEAGTCQVTAKSCSDGNPCTTDSCDPASGCINGFNTDPCDDGNACTTDEACTLGECEATDTSACGCASDLDCAPYEDGDLCNGRLACIDDVCQVSPGSVVVCDDSANTECFFTTCNPGSGQCETVVPEGTPCEDGSGCTIGDTCAAGVCEPGASQCGCDVDADCADFDDGNACNGTLVCNAGLCQVSLASVVSCQDTPTAECEMAVCNASSGGCEVVARPDGDSCDDGDACTVATTCEANSCQGGVPLDCEDGNPCTDHACNSTTGCSTSLTGCDDGDACTVDTCDEATGCTTVAVECDDGNVCTVDSCDPATGCVNDPDPCDDGDACTADLCDAVTGCYSVATACPDDGDPCTVETCDPATGCSSTPIPCTDNDACTTDSCNSATGGCEFVAIDCDDGDACTTDGCDPATGCSSEVVVCDDGDACTFDSCAPAAGCSAEAVVCDDGDACTTNGCDPATGCTSQTVVCDDGDACTTDGCAPETGCTTAVVDCDDSDACTVDSCQAGTGSCQNDPLDCDDGDACTNDGCDAATGCTTEAVVCDDGDVCTDDSCSPAVGCETTPTVCANDGDPCTEDACVAGQGCVYPPKDCEDGDLCTTDTCVGNGQCQHAPKCQDGTACTQDICDPTTGACTHVDACDDHYACTVGTCVPLGAEASALSCEALGSGWNPSGTREICVKSIGNCANRTHAEAVDECEAIGARLCDTEEIASDAAGVTSNVCGASASGKPIWTRNACPTGHVVLSPRLSDDPECRASGDVAGTACCADVAPATAGRCEQAPISDAPGCHAVEAMSLVNANGCYILAGGQLQCEGTEVTLPMPPNSVINDPQRFFGSGHWNNVAPTPIVDVTGQPNRQCIVDAGGRVSCFGDLAFSSIDPVFGSQVKTYAMPASILGVAVANGAVCARGTEGLYCWGRNDRGQLGLGHQDDVADPTEVPFFSGVAIDRVAARRALHVCVLTNGSVYCWGENAGGRLGLGDTVDRSTPEEVTLPMAATELAVYLGKTAVVLDNGEIWAWGAPYGSTPVHVSFGPDQFVAVEPFSGSGVNVLAGLDADGLVWLTGNNQDALWPPGKTDPASPNNATPRATELFDLQQQSPLTQTKAGGQIENNNGVLPWVGNLGSACDTDFDCWSHYCHAGMCDLPCSADDGLACTTTRAVLPDVSPSTCDALPGFSYFDLSEVCGDRICTSQNHASATDACAALGGRLCTQEEAQAGAVIGQCGVFDMAYAWTATPCGDNHFMAVKYPEATVLDTPECVDASQSRRAHCCADKTRTPPRVCRHVPEWNPGECCNGYDGSTTCP